VQKLFLEAALSQRFCLLCLPWIAVVEPIQRSPYLCPVRQRNFSSEWHLISQESSSTLALVSGRLVGDEPEARSKCVRIAASTRHRKLSHRGCPRFR
jgi:hypothetical protein